MCGCPCALGSLQRSPSPITDFNVGVSIAARVNRGGLLRKLQKGKTREKMKGNKKGE